MTNSKLNQKFIDEVINACEGPETLEDEGTRLRDQIFLRIAEKLSYRGNISYFDLMDFSLDFLEKLIIEVENVSGQKRHDKAIGVLAYELSCTLSKIYPSLDKMKMFKSLLAPHL